MKTILKLKINLIRNTLNFVTIQRNNLQASPISWDFPFKEPWTTEDSRTTTTKAGKMILTDRRASQAERKSWPMALTGDLAMTSPNAECKLCSVKF
jgi:hypothetical protein